MMQANTVIPPNNSRRPPLLEVFFRVPLPKLFAEPFLDFVRKLFLEEKDKRMQQVIRRERGNEELERDPQVANFIKEMRKNIKENPNSNEVNMVTYNNSVKSNTNQLPTFESGRYV